jgi:three-Cys-motif partner protein
MEFGGGWSESKLDCVEGYAVSYLQVMRHQDWCDLEYVDAFAGRGRQVRKTGAPELEDPLGMFGDEAESAAAEEFLVGSAIRALRASAISARGFDKFVFIEANQRSCDELTDLVHHEFPDVASKVHITCGDANVALQDYLRRAAWSRRRGLVFLDPYGLEVGWDLITELSATKACDVWYLFPLGGAIRMMTNSGEIPAEWSSRLDGLFGTHDWYSEFYSPSGQASLFGSDEELVVRDVSTLHVVDYIRRRLGDVFPAVSNAAVLRNTKGAPLFALVLGVSNPSPKAQTLALKIANYLVKGLSG